MSDPGFVVHDSTGNVFEDMGMPDAAARLARYERDRDMRLSRDTLRTAPTPPASPPPAAPAE